MTAHLTGVVVIDIYVSVSGALLFLLDDPWPKAIVLLGLMVGQIDTIVRKHEETRIYYNPLFGALVQYAESLRTSH